MTPFFNVRRLELVLQAKARGDVENVRSIGAILDGIEADARGRVRDGMA